MYSTSPLKFAELASWPIKWSIFINVLCTGEKNVYYKFCDDELCYSNFCPFVFFGLLYLNQRGVFKLPTMLVGLSVLSCGSMDAFVF